MLFGNTVKLAHMTLGLVPKILNTVDMILLVCKEFGMIDPEVFEVQRIQCVVASPIVGINDAVRHDLAFNNRA